VAIITVVVQVIAVVATVMVVVMATGMEVTIATREQLHDPITMTVTVDSRPPMEDFSATATLTSIGGYYITGGY